MSKKRKKHSQKKKHNQQGKQSVRKIESKKKFLNFQPVKTFFIDLKEKLRLGDNINKFGQYLSRNKKGFIFTVAMIAIVTVGYFTVVYQPKEPAVVSVDLNEEQTSFMDDVGNEIGDIQGEPETVTASLDAPVEEATTEEMVLEEVAAEKVEEMASEDAIQPPIDVITSADITGDKISLEVIEDKPAYDTVRKSMMLGVDMFAILVDHQEVAYFETEDEANALLEELQAKYLAEGAVEERVIFRESVEVKAVKRDVFECDGFKTAEEIMEFIVKGTNEQRIHVVEKGENFWVIAEEYELNVDDLLDANPGIDEKRLQIGTELSLIVAEPIINVVTISKVERVDPVPYGRAPNVLTDKYYEGEYKTKQAGIPGEAEVTLEVYMENGKLIGEKVLNQNIITEPIEQIVYQGTKPAPPKKGTGVFANPTSRGYITSPFGPRSLGYHNGIDIGIPSGTEVKAADGGLVKFSGYKGTYGKLIIIDHGANKETRYAHNSVLKVKAGENVFKGQLIALSGNTGRSTGPHLHFEVRVNGNPVNPKKYVSY